MRSLGRISEPCSMQSPGARSWVVGSERNVLSGLWRSVTEGKLIQPCGFKEGSELQVSLQESRRQMTVLCVTRPLICVTFFILPLQGCAGETLINIVRYLIKLLQHYPSFYIKLLASKNYCLKQADTVNNLFAHSSHQAEA